MTALTQRALTESDAPAFAALTNAVADAGGSGSRTDEAEFLYLLHHPMAAPGFEDLQGVFDGDRLVAQANVVRRAEADPVHWMISNGSVHPEYQGRGIGAQLVRWQEDCARRIHEHYFPGHAMDLSTYLVESDKSAQELLTNEGYAPLRWSFKMRRPADAPQSEAELPAGLVLETCTSDPGLIEELRVAHNEAFREHWRFVTHTAEDWSAWLTGAQRRLDLSYLLRDPADGQIAGYLISTFKEAEAKADGTNDLHLSVIGTRGAYRGRGIASALIAHVVRASREQGFEGADLTVDAENPTGALGVYERSGFACVRKSTHYAKTLVP
jgi:ribosomal protein S18 acetylase RimI-like enzyme